MNDIIRQFYEKNHLPKPIIDQKIAAFSRHSDIAAEFEQWISDRTYKIQDAVTVEGYNAKKLSVLSEYLNGDGAFILLIELRENPRKAHKRIEQDFKYK
ncbi:MAG: hypothetical protein ACI4J2_09395 [Ruminococcus sp.]